MKKRDGWRGGLAFVAALVLVVSAASAQDGAARTKGASIYVPVYSHIYSGDREQPFLLTVTLSVRNTDPDQGLSITAVDYFDSKGKRIKKYLAEPLRLGPLEATRFVVAQSDKSGGSGASFIVVWTSEKPVCPPIVESVMIGTQLQQGVSFTSRGQVIAR